MQLLEHKRRYLALFLGTILILTVGYLAGVAATGNWPSGKSSPENKQAQSDQENNDGKKSDATDKASDSNAHSASDDKATDKETEDTDAKAVEDMIASLNQDQVKTVKPDASGSNDFYSVSVDELTFDNEAVVTVYTVTASEKLGDEGITIDPKAVTVDYNRVEPAKLTFSTDGPIELTSGKSVTFASKSDWATDFTVAYLLIAFPSPLGKDQAPLAQPLILRAGVSASE